VGAPRVVGAGDREAVLAALDAGLVVAVPTDTVYGLAARVDRPDGLAALFGAKGRPSDLALPVLIGDREQVHLVAAGWPRPAAVLAARFWPGPLTLVVPALGALGPLLGGDGRTVGLRHPAHEDVRALCRVAGPLAVTSANRHGEPPCTTVAETAAAFACGSVALAVDGGRCDGVPSTVVDCTVSPPACLRGGAVPWDRVVAALR